MTEPRPPFPPPPDRPTVAAGAAAEQVEAVEQVEPAGIDAVGELRAELTAGDGRLGRYAARARLVVRLLAGVVVLTGVVALVLGLAAWRDSPVGRVAVGLACLPAIAAPLYVARRTSALADAAAHPRELADQAGDLVGSLRHSPELTALAQRLRHRGRTATAEAGRRSGRLGRALGLARLTSSVIGQAAPDPVRHRLLVPLRPERLRSTWLAVVVSAWGWGIAAGVAMVSSAVLLVRLAGW